MPPKRDVNKPRGRTTAYAYFMQACREEHKNKHPDENVVFAEFSKKCAERWKTMSDKEKKRFNVLAVQDKERFDGEMEHYVPSGDGARGTKRSKKDPNAPKRPLTAFFLFSNDERSAVKAANPNFTVGDVAKELGRLWKATSDQEKERYKAISESAKEQYQRDLNAYSNKKPKAEEDEGDEEDEEFDDDD